MVLELEGLLKMESSFNQLLEHSYHLLLRNNLVVDHVKHWAPIHSGELIELGRGGHVIVAISEGESSEVSSFNNIFESFYILCSHNCIKYFLVQLFILCFSLKMLISLMLFLVCLKEVMQFLHCCHLFWLTL